MATPVQKDSLTLHQKTLHRFLQIESPWTGTFNGNDINASDFNNSRVIALPDIRVDDFIVDSELARVGSDLYSGSQFTSEWKNGIPPVEWRQYTASRTRSFGYLVLDDQLAKAAIPNLPQEYLARKMQTTVIRDHDKYIALAIVSGRMTGKLVPRVNGVDTYGPVTQDVHRIANTGNAADYKWIAEPGEDYDNEIQPSFATIKGMDWDQQDPFETLDALTLLYAENWWDSNYGTQRVLFITTAMELVFRDLLIDKGAYIEAGYDLYKNSDVSGANGPSFLGVLRGNWRLMKVHPEFMPKVFVDASNVVDPNPVLTGVGTATNRTLKQVAALAAYTNAAQVHEFFSNQLSERGGIRFKGTAYVQEMSYDAWVIDQKSEGIVPLFLPTDLDGNGTTDANYTVVNDSFTRVANYLSAARAQKTTSPSQYPASGADVNLSTPYWYTNPFIGAKLNGALTVQEAGDVSTRQPVLPGDNPVDARELAGLVSATLSTATARANSTAVTQGQQRKFTGPNSLWEVTVAGTTAAAQPAITTSNIGSTVVDGGATWKRIL